jgi:hypothetical protein
MCLQKYAESSDFVSLAKNYQTELAEKSCMNLAITVQCQCTSTAVQIGRDGIRKRTLSLGFLGKILRVLRLEVSTLVFCLSTRCYS